MVEAIEINKRFNIKIFTNLFSRITLYHIFMASSMCNSIYISEILLAIKGNKTQQILNNKSINLYYTNTQTKNYQFNTKPSEILVNGIRINKIDFYVYNLTSEVNNITIRFNKSLTNCNVMFGNLANIIYINFDHFDTSKVIKITGMFYGCRNLVSLDLSHFNTKFVNEMGNMFYYCTEIIYLDLSSFNTSSVTNMINMFRQCNNLISLDLSKFDTSLVTTMDCMFSGCKKIISLDLRSFNTSYVTEMDDCFIIVVV